MWRICNCAQLKPFLNGCKRCQLPAEVNSNMKNKGTSRSRTPQTLSARNNIKETRNIQKKPENKFIIWRPYSFQRNFNSNLCINDSSCELPVWGEPEIYARKTLTDETNSEMDYNKNLPAERNMCAEKKAKMHLKMYAPQKRTSTKHTWYDTRKFEDRWKYLLRESSHSTDKAIDDQFYDCEEPSLVTSVLATMPEKVLGNSLKTKRKPTSSPTWNLLRYGKRWNYQVNESSNEQSSLFNKLKALPLLNIGTSKYSNPIYRAQQPKSCRDQTPSICRKKSIDVEADSLFVQVQKSSREMWRKMILDNIISNKNVSDSSSPTITRLTPHKEMQLRGLNQYSNDMQEGNNKGSTFTCNAALQSNRNKLLVPPVNTNGLMAKTHLMVLRHQKSKFIKNLKRNLMRDADAYHTRYLPLSKNTDSLRSAKEKSMEQNGFDHELIKKKEACELREIDSIIDHCHTLKNMYKMSLNKRKQCKLQEPTTMFERKGWDANQNQKQQLMVENILETGSKDIRQHNNCPIDSAIKQAQLQKSMKAAKKNEDEQICQAARKDVTNLRHKVQESEREQKERQKSVECFPGQCQETKTKIQEEKCVATKVEGKSKSKKTEQNGAITELHKSLAKNIREKTELIERIYTEAQNKVAELNRKVNKYLEKQNLKEKKKNAKDPTDDGVSKYILSPRPRLYSFQRDRQDCNVATGSRPGSRCQLLGLQNQSGIIESGGVLDALGNPYGRRLDSKFYLFHLQNRLALADSRHQQQSSLMQDKHAVDAEENRQQLDESFMSQWARRFAELPLQLRPGSNILLPLPHSKGSYLIGESDPLSPLKWPNLTVGKEFEYDDSDY